MGQLGLDCAGVVIEKGKNVVQFEVGDKVFGNTPGCLGRFIVSNANSFNKDASGSLSFQEMATIPVASLTAYVALIELAKLASGEKILIHTAAGGVGIAAVQLATAIGAKIYATTSTQEKRDFLNKTFGVKNIYNSRTLEFAQELLSDTNGEGVDVVLNTLTGEGFVEKSLSVCAKGGRFIELSRINIMDNEDVKKLRPDISYTVMTDDVVSIPPEKLTFYKHFLMESLKNRTFKPLPYKCFHVTDIKKALQFLQLAKHIGKVIIEFPKEPIALDKLNAKLMSGS